MRKVQWCYSFNNEDFKYGTFGSKKEALCDARETKLELELEQDYVYIGKCYTPTNDSMFPDADTIIEYMACQADDLGGEYSNDYPDVSSEAEKELTDALHKLLNKWCEKHEVSPTFYTVESSSKVKL